MRLRNETILKGTFNGIITSNIYVRPLNSPQYAYVQFSFKPDIEIEGIPEICVSNSIVS